ncbi:MAG: DUF3179 domain-containing protein [Thiolinea sp.]
MTMKNAGNNDLNNKMQQHHHFQGAERTSAHVSMQRRLPAAIRTFIQYLLLLLIISTPATANNSQASSHFLNLLGTSEAQHQSNLQYIDSNWHPGFVPMALEILRFSDNRTLNNRLAELLSKHTGQNFGLSIKDWYRWQWKQAANPHPEYNLFKARLYEQIDPRFAAYFKSGKPQDIRLDEVRWGGVLQDGIPPLRQPKMIRATDRAARYLEDDNIVFGVAVNGDVRAYPQRILAWHEMFIDTIGGIEYAGVYCTLCGSVVLYETHVKGTRHQLGTSGFLFRSNKLMYDKATQSLWNSTWGKPVLGPLTGKGIQLKQGHVVTTTWGEWRRRHPETLVLSLETGHKRDYGEGVAYKNYFATHKLMFEVPEKDNRLKNKDEVLALRFSNSRDTLAIHDQYLLKHPIHHDKVGPQQLVVFTDNSGANRVYASKGLHFTTYNGDNIITDSRGQQWTLHEDKLEGANGQILPRLPARRAFWFGWFAAYNDTRLVK